MSCTACKNTIDNLCYVLPCGHRYHTACLARKTNNQLSASPCDKCHLLYTQQTIIVENSHIQIALASICDMYLTIVAYCVMMS